MFVPELKRHHGSEAVQNGGLTGSTDTDYFYFFCPKCPNKHIMRILEYTVKERTEVNKYNTEFKIKAKNGFVLAFDLYCENCKHRDLVKISNIGWQGGTHDEALGKISSS